MNDLKDLFDILKLNSLAMITVQVVNSVINLTIIKATWELFLSRSASVCNASNPFCL